MAPRIPHAGNFKPGQSGNPDGRRREKPFADALRIELKENFGNRTKLRAIAERLVALALDGNMDAIKEVANRTDGRSIQPVSGPDGVEPIQIVVQRLTDAIHAADEDPST